MANPYVVYGLQLSYFTRKFEAAMQWYGVPVEHLAKSPSVQSELESRAATKQIPVLRTPENWLIADTTPMMDFMDGRVPARRMFPTGALGVLVHVVEEWFDEWVPRTCLHYRWQYDESAEWAAANMANEIAPDADESVRTGIAQMVTGWGKRACRAVGISEESQQKAGEAEYLRILEALDEQLSHTAFTLGDRPCAVDAVVLGGLKAHFAADPVPSRVVAKFDRVSRWIETAGDWDGTGELLPFPESTPFARFVLTEMAATYRPYVLGNAGGLTASSKAFVATVNGESVSYRTRPYPETSRQMVRDRIQLRLSPEERDTVLKWLDDVGLADCFGAAPSS